MSKTKKDLIFIAIIWALVFFIYILIHNYTHSEIRRSMNCPAGSYDAGDFCKKEPTGCPYGDSLDKDTCAKFEDNQQIKKPIQFKPVDNYEQYIGK